MVRSRQLVQDVSMGRMKTAWQLDPSREPSTGQCLAGSINVYSPKCRAGWNPTTRPRPIIQRRGTRDRLGAEHAQGQFAAYRPRAQTRPPSQAAKTGWTWCIVVQEFRRKAVTSCEQTCQDRCISGIWAAPPPDTRDQGNGFKSHRHRQSTGPCFPLPRRRVGGLF